MAKKIPEQVWTHWLPVFGIAGVMLYYALFLYRYALNIPFADDIYDVLQFLSDVTQSTEWKHTVELFFAQTNEHRTLSSRLVYYLMLIVAGEINFRTLIFLANLAIPLLITLLYFAIRSHSRALLILLPVALVLFQFRAYEIHFWTMAGFAYMYVYVFAFASLSCLRQVNLTRFLAALVFASLGTFTLASGQLIWLVGFASLLHQSLVVRRIALTYAACWMVCAAMVLIAWRIGYETQFTMQFILNDFLFEPQHHITYFLVLLGNAAGENSVLLAACTGSVLLLVVGYSSVYSITRKDISLQLFACFIVLSVFAMALGRAPFTDLNYALSSRYGFPSVLLLATTIALLCSSLSVNSKILKRMSVITLLAAVYWVSSFQIYPAKAQVMQAMTVGNFNWGKYWAYGSPYSETGPIVEKATALGIYKPPARPHPAPNTVPSS